jgi:hypothetical protein
VRRSALSVLAAVALALPLVGGAAATSGATGLATLDDYPAPAVTGAQLAAGVERFSEGFPLRITGTPTQLQAHDALVAEAKGLGLQVETKTYNGVLTAIVARKEGTSRKGETIIFGGHYDNMVGTVEGAYDNGTGTRMVMELARSFKDVPTHHSLEFHFYNGEEQGARASTEVAAEYARTGKKVAAFLGFDMVGIAWPIGVPNANSCLCMWHGSGRAELGALLRQVNFEYLKFPEGPRLVSVEGPNTRNSDEASWHRNRFATLRWAGLKTASSYPQYHLPLDNMDTIYEVAGGKQNFELGMKHTLVSAYYTAAAIDLGALDPEE